MSDQLNAKQTAKLNSYQTTEKHVDDNASIIAAIPAFLNTFTKFKGKIAAIRHAAQQKSAVLAGITENKANSRKTLSDLTVSVAGLVYSYAAEKSDNVLREEMKVPASKLTRTKDANLAPLCQNIHDKAKQHLAALADYNLNQAKLTELQTAIDAFNAANPTTHAARSNRKTTNININDLFDQTDDILTNQLDKQIESLRETQPDFVNTYFSTRNIIDPPSRARKPEESADKKP